MKKRLRVAEVTDGMFTSERFVRFNAGGRTYTLFVDERSVRDNMLEVRVVDQNESEALIELPRDAMGSGSRVRVEKGQLVAA